MRVRLLLLIAGKETLDMAAWMLAVRKRLQSGGEQRVITPIHSLITIGTSGCRRRHLANPGKSRLNPPTRPSPLIRIPLEAAATLIETWRLS